MIFGDSKPEPIKEDVLQYKRLLISWRKVSFLDSMLEFKS
jgi:hypothetical protein